MTFLCVVMASSQYRKKPRDAFGAFEQRVLRRRRGWTVVIGPEIRYIAVAATAAKIRIPVVVIVN